MKIPSALINITIAQTGHTILYALVKWTAATVLLYGSLKFNAPVMGKYRAIATLFIPMLSILFIILSHRSAKICHCHSLGKWEKALFNIELQPCGGPEDGSP